MNTIATSEVVILYKNIPVAVAEVIDCDLFHHEKVNKSTQAGYSLVWTFENIPNHVPLLEADPVEGYRYLNELV